MNVALIDSQPYLDLLVPQFLPAHRRLCHRHVNVGRESNVVNTPAQNALVTDKEEKALPSHVQPLLLHVARQLGPTPRSRAARLHSGKCRPRRLPIRSSWCRQCQPSRTRPQHGGLRRAPTAPATLHAFTNFRGHIHPSDQVMKCRY